MKLGELGEFGLIERIIARLGEAAARDILVPPGDDAAAWAHRGATRDSEAPRSPSSTTVEAHPRVSMATSTLSPGIVPNTS